MKAIVVSMQCVYDWDGNTKEFHKFVIMSPKYSDIIKEVEDVVFDCDMQIRDKFGCSKIEYFMGHSMERTKVYNLYNLEGDIAIGKELHYVAKDNACRLITLYVYYNVDVEERK